MVVTGSSGFLGAGLCRALQARGEEPLRLNSRNLGAWAQAGDFCLLHPGEQWLVNQQITTSVLGAPQE